MTQSEKTNTTIIPIRGTLISQFFTLTSLTAYLYVFMEWLFFVTKPSFFDTISTAGKISILFKTGLLFTLTSFAGLFSLMVLSWIFSRVMHNKDLQRLPVIIPAAILSALALLLVDNFTYTLFKVGVITTTGIWRGAYALLFILTFLSICRWLLKNHFLEVAVSKERISSRSRPFQIFALILMSCSFVIALLDRSGSVNGGGLLPGAKLQKRPNILLLGGDGINAANVSAYGYERDTTPNIRLLAEKSLLMENAFTNAGNSSGSVITILTGKNATTTRVLYPPDILKGNDAYQHLVGILHQQGYYTAELGIIHFIDAYDMNLQSGFDEVNGKVTRQPIILRLLEPLGYEVAYFASEIFNRIEDRLFHIFYIKKMENAYANILQPVPGMNHDDKKIKRLLDLIEESDKPLFMHIHIMGTHGNIFFPRRQVFSNGEEQTEPWLTDFYDDAILDYDYYVGRVINQLAQAGKLENTIIVIYTDHNMKWTTDQRIPLIIHFPQDAYAGRVQQNAQNIDIAPTILDYLGVPIPDWMEGTSLLNGEPGDERLIFSMGATQIKESGDLVLLDAEKIKPPFYQFGYIGIVNCQNWYRYNLVDNLWESGPVRDHTSKCSGDKLLSPEQIRDALLKHLTSKGFDISSLVNNIGTPAPVVGP